MGESGQRNGSSTATVEALQNVVPEAVASGMPSGEIFRVVQGALPEVPGDLDDWVRVYDKPPEGLIMLPMAMEKYGFRAKRCISGLTRSSMDCAVIIKLIEMMMAEIRQAFSRGARRLT